MNKKDERTRIIIRGLLVVFYRFLCEARWKINAGYILEYRRDNKDRLESII